MNSQIPPYRCRNTHAQRACALAVMALFCVAPAMAAATLDNVLVTGEKMPRSLLKTSTAVSLFDEQQLDQGELQSLNEVSSRVPNMTINPTGGVNIRGVEGTGVAVGVRAFIGGGRPRISTSIDGAGELWTGQQYLDHGLWDAARVEVLRGPQSTTQGRNAIGGTVVLQTRDPVFATEGAVRLGWHDQDDSFTLAGMLNVPLIENRLAMRLTAEGMRGDSYVQYRGFAPDDPSQQEQHALRGKWLWQPVSGVESKLMLSSRKMKGHYLNIINSRHDEMSFNLNPASNVRNQDSDSRTLVWDNRVELADGIVAHLQYSTADSNIRFRQFPAAMNLQLDNRQHELEGRLVFRQPQSRLSGVVGLYGFDRKQQLDASRPQAAVFAGHDRLKTTAWFADGDFALDERLDLLFGARVEKERQQRDILGWGSVPIKADINKQVFLPKLGLNYRYAPQSSLSLLLRKGYNPGGVAVDENNQVYQYDSEHLLSYELGLKTRWGNSRIAANLFHNVFRDYQMDQLASNGVSRLQNMPKGKTYGAELSLDGTLANGLQWYGNLGYLQSRIDQAPAWGNNVAGNQFAYAPQWTLGGGLKQYWGAAFASVDASHVTSYYTDSSNSAANKAGDFTLVNLMAGYEFKQATVRAFLKNALNDETVQRRFAGRRGNDLYIGAPRTLGVNVDYRF